MKVLIAEDVALVAERIADLAKVYLNGCQTKIAYTLREAHWCITEDVYDLLLLDLNLNGEDGFDLLESAVAASFQTIVVTANREEAVRAFDLGVFDFISKPIAEARFEKAMNRFLNQAGASREQLKHLAIKTKGIVKLIDIGDVEFIKASGNYSEIYTSKNTPDLHNKNLDKLLKVLPGYFIRVHRSYLVPKNKVARVIKHGGGKYDLELGGGSLVPLSREVYKKWFLGV